MSKTTAQALQAVVERTLETHPRGEHVGDAIHPQHTRLTQGTVEHGVIDSQTGVPTATAGGVTPLASDTSHR